MRLNKNINKPDELQRYYLNVLPEYFQWAYVIGGTYRYYSDNRYDVVVLSRNMLSNRNYKYIDNNKSNNKLSDYISTESENRLRYESVYTNLPVRLMYGAGVMLSHYTNETYRQLYINNQTTALNYQTKYYLFSYQAFVQVSDTYIEEKLKLSVGLSLVGNSYNKNMANPLKDRKSVV